MSAHLPLLPADPRPDPNLEFAWGVAIPLRDGVRLNATLYRPRGPERTPAIFTLTPYTADSYHARAYYFAQRGYAFLLVDCRGRGNSGGVFEPFVNEGRDGHDVAQWLAGQPWCDGQVTMWGGSYGGFDQWLTLRQAPAALKTIVPAAACYAGVDFPFFKNIFHAYEMQWLTLTSGVTANQGLFNEQAFWIQKFRELYLAQRPFAELDQVVGNAVPHFATWTAHPHPDAYWDQLALTPADYDRLTCPILTITGHYDGDQPGALQYYREHMRSASPARDRHYLVIGPWDHAGTRTPNREVGGLTFGEASLVDLNLLHREWYDWTLKAGPRPAFLKQRVAYYLMGADEWRYADSLEAVTGEPRRLYLSAPAGQANDVFRAGVLTPAEPPADAPAGQYVYDPRDLRPAELETAEVKAYLTDQRYALNLYGAGLIYHSAPLEADTDVAGSVRLTAWITLDVPDTDFQALVYEVARDGASCLLTADILRARYRDSRRAPRPVPVGVPQRYDFTGFTFFARRLARGSRLRLVLSAINSIYYEKNYNSGGEVARETAAVARVAHVTVHHAAGQASYLEVPLAAASGPAHAA